MYFFAYYIFFSLLSDIFIFYFKKYEYLFCLLFIKENMITNLLLTKFSNKINDKTKDIIVNLHIFFNWFRFYFHLLYFFNKFYSIKYFQNYDFFEITLTSHVQTVRILWLRCSVIRAFSVHKQFSFFSLLLSWNEKHSFNTFCDNFFLLWFTNYKGAHLFIMDS